MGGGPFFFPFHPLSLNADQIEWLSLVIIDM